MIARIWRGVTRSADAERYQEYLNQVVLPSCQTAEGNQGLYILKECQGELVHFLVLTFWTSKEALSKYIRASSDVVNPSPGEKELLIAYESIARHYRVVGSVA